jgi:hypothetical protein
MVDIKASVDGNVTHSLSDKKLLIILVVKYK